MTLRDGSDETGCNHYYTEAGLRAEVERETREKVAREILAKCDWESKGWKCWEFVNSGPTSLLGRRTCTHIEDAEIARGKKYE